MKYGLILLSAILLTACNNSGDSKDKKDDTVAMQNTHDTMHHAPTAGGVPELPAVPEGAKVFFKNLKEGASISSPFKLEMGVEVIKVDTAGPVVAGSGHHHLLINGPDSFAAGEVIPKDSLHIHFGKGQTDYELNLGPGKYKLTLQMADGLHRSYGGQLAAAINVTVKK
ncbi:MAG: DUF4399 domain-containing protein [Bacteroidota bacterium]